MPEQSRLRWRCRRGIKEMDLLLESYLERYYFDLAESEQESFSMLLDENDLDIYEWILGRSTPENPAYKPIIEQLQTIKRVRD